MSYLCKDYHKFINSAFFKWSALFLLLSFLYGYCSYFSISPFPLLLLLIFLYCYYVFENAATRLFSLLLWAPLNHFKVFIFFFFFYSLSYSLSLSFPHLLRIYGRFRPCCIRSQNYYTETFWYSFSTIQCFILRFLRK